MSDLPVPEAKTPKEITALFVDALRKVDAENPKPEDVQAFSTLLDKYPYMWGALGDLAERAQRTLIDQSPFNAGRKASLKKGIGEIAKELSRPNDTALERMVIDQVILCWLRVHETEACYQSAHQKSIRYSDSEFWERKLTAAQHRYLRAIESLARVRKLASVTIRVQVEQTARRQIEQPYKVVDST